MSERPPRRIQEKDTSSLPEGQESSGVLSQIDMPRVKKRSRGINVVPQACPHCRKSKAKCDGARPRCSNCVLKNKPCSYVGDAGQTMLRASLIRLEVLDGLFKLLQTQPAEEAEKLLHRVRAVKVQDLSQLLGDSSSSKDQGPDVAISGLPSSVSSPCSQITPDVDPAPASERQPPTPCRQHLVVAEIVLPDRQLLIEATEIFYSSSLELFHVFCREDISEMMSLVDKSPIPPQDTGSAVALACVAAVAAVGARYPRANVDKDMPRGLYEVARYYFNVVIETNPLDAIKLCVLFAMYNLMGQSPASLIYIDHGLNMARRQGLYNRDPRFANLTARRWKECRMAWRTLLCLSSWVPGYNMDRDDERPSTLRANLDMGPLDTDMDVLHSEMTNISLLKAELLRFRLVNPTMDVYIMEAANADLRDWYARLPDTIRLLNVQSFDHNNGVQCCIFYTHLLHLDAIMLLATRATTQFLHNFGFRGKADVDWTLLHQGLVSQVAEGVLAASQCSRIFALFRGADVIHNISWLVTNQAYASCSMLLHTAAQKQAHGHPRDEWAGYLAQAETCLSVLEACSVTDTTATQLWERLSVIHGMIASSSPGTLMRPPDLLAAPSLEWEDNTYLVTRPPDTGPNQLEMPKQLLKLLSHPFHGVFED